LILISLLIMAIQASYPDVTLQTTKIQFEGQTLACGEKETFGTQSTRFAERQTQQVFEDLYLSFTPSTQKHTLSLDFLIQSPHSKATLEVDQLFEKVASLCEIEEDIESFGMFYLSHIQLCIHIFPFKAVLSSLPSLDLYLFNALLSHPKAKQLVLSLERTFQIKANFQNKIEGIKEGAKLLESIVQKAKEEAQKQNIDFNALIIQTLYEEVKKYPQNILFQGLIGQWRSPSISIEILKPDFKGFLVALLQAWMIECIDKLWINAYEQQKKAYEILVYTRLRDKYHAPLALKREEGVYYPIKIFHTSLSFSFQNIILGGRFCTGGIGQAQGYFYKICQTQSSQVRNNNTLENFDIVKQYQLGMLFGLLCLDELRDAKTEEKTGKKTEDHIFFRQNHSKKKFRDYVLNLDKEQDLILYESYGGGSQKKTNNQASAIDSYQV
ncbi:hypothetical protein LW138_07100, partial [Helicobacter sp. faydin-H17]|nr:hypothetical protein [Helicobacter kayseriensis]MCE3049204.1 hypothetical protein [Helicobacter kayseriensis]